MADPSGLPAHDTLLALRERMRARGSEAADTSPAALAEELGRIPVVTVDTADQAARAAAAGAATRTTNGAAAASSSSFSPAAADGGSQPPASMLSELKRAQALRERIHSRDTMPISEFTHEKTKDTYAHEQPFPVRTVFEMDSVTTKAHHGDHRGPSETFLMAAESAAVLRAVESRLGHESERAVIAEKRLQVNTNALDQVTKDRDQKKLELDVANAKIKELKEDMEKLKKEHTTATEALKKEHTTEMNTQKVGIELKMKADVNLANDEAKKTATARTELETEKKLLEALVAEMREQLATNGVALQNQTNTIRELTDELLSARGQVMNLSVALQDKERELKNAKADLHRCGSDAAKFADVKADLARVTDELERAKLDMTKMTRDSEALVKVTEERDRLHTINLKLEAEMREKTTEMARLRAQVDAVRSQADAAYQHSSQFHGQGAAAAQGGSYAPPSGAAHGYPAPGGMPPPPPHGGAPNAGGLDALRREIEEEERRANDDTRRWRQRVAKS